jgi:hypothetical protein
MTIDVALLRQLAAQPNTKVREDFTELALKSIGTVLLKPTTVAELLDAYEERERLRAALAEQGLLQKKPGGGMLWHAHGCPASFDFAQCNYRCRVARAALEGRE